MASKLPLRLVLVWHMHQPDFRDFATGEFNHPWVYLHAIKDYSDMAAHLEQHPSVHAVVNLVPILLDQLEDYAEQFASGHIRDRLLRLLMREKLDDVEPAERRFLLDQCFRANHSKMVEPYTRYKRLRDLYTFVQTHGSDCADYLSGQYLADLVTWYHLAWTGETLRRKEETIVQLMSKGEGFTASERKQLFDLLGAVIQDIVPRYRRLAESGRVELSTTPHYHPIGPLMLDFNAARDSIPDAPLPQADHYAGGRTRLAWHVQEAMRTHNARFQQHPVGMWPAEGAVSHAFLEVLSEHRVGWVASGEAVLTNTLRSAGKSTSDRMDFLYRPYAFEAAGHRMLCFFRNDRLSDMIGFEYKGWHGKDAAGHFIAQLEEIHAKTPPGQSPVVSVILDGENAWEYYPYNAYYFLDELYLVLGAHPDIRTATYAEVLAEPEGNGGQGESGFVRPLPKLVAGSWVYGNLSTWIGSDPKNRAWDLLCSAKQSYNLVMASGRLNESGMHAALRQLAICEGSDWFWWFGDYNPAQSVSTFDQLFRANLANLYRLLHLPAPAQLSEPISRGGVSPESGGSMRRTT